MPAIITLVDPFGLTAGASRILPLLLATLMSLGVSADALAPTRPPLVTLVGPDEGDPGTSCDRFHKALGPGIAAMRVSCMAAGATDMARHDRAVADAVRSGSALIVAPGGGPASAAVHGSRGIPVVFAISVNPVPLLVPSLDRPGSHATGVSVDDTLHSKRLEFIREAFPHVRRLGVLVDRWWADGYDLEQQMIQPARALGLTAELHIADDLPSLDALMHSPAASAVDAWYLPPTYVAYVAEDALIAHMARLRLPAMHSTRREVERGALLAYAQDTGFTYRAMADMTQRILAGEAPGQIPIERPRHFMLTARVVDDPRRQIAPSLLRRAQILP